MFSDSGHRRFLVLLIVGLSAYLLNLVYQEKWKVYEPARYTETAMVVNPECDLAKQECHAVTDGLRLAIRLAGELQSMKRFQIFAKAVDGSTIQLDAVDVQFSMKDMYMGENHYALHKQDQTNWQADVVLPVCASGHSDWILEVLARSGDQVYRVEMPFQLER